MSITFDNKRAINDFKAYLIVTLRQLQMDYVTRAVSHMNRPEAKTDLDLGKIEDVADELVAYVIGGAWVAMDNYGRGSLIDVHNPAFAAYMANKELWNPDRRDMSIRTRPSGGKNIFGRPHKSKSRGGRLLEPPRSEWVEKPKYAPWPPSHALQTTARWLMNGKLQERLQAAIAAFDWSKYLIIRVK